MIPSLELLLTTTAGNDSVKVLDYFTKNGAPCPPEANPAEHIVDVIQGKANEKVDWVEAWNQSEERQHAMTELEALNNASKADPDYEENQTDFATPMWFQFRMVWERLMTQLWRSPVGKPANTKKKGNTLTTVGLYVEQNHPSHLCRFIQRLHILDDWRWYILTATAAIRHLQLHLRGSGLYQSDAAILPS